MSVEPAQSRYVLPSFVERTSYGVKESNPYNKLFEERIIFLGVQIDDASANDVMAQLLVLESIDPDRDILMYINSPGGLFTSLMAIYDTMQYVRPEISTVCLGQAASAAAVLLAAGTPGKRLAVPNARILHPPAGHRGHLRPGVGPGDPGRGDLPDAQAAGGDAGQAQRQDARAGPAGHRARQVPDGRGGQGVRDHRRHHPEPQARARRLSGRPRSSTIPLHVQVVTGAHSGEAELVQHAEPCQPTPAGQAGPTTRSLMVARHQKGRTSGSTPHAGPHDTARRLASAAKPSTTATPHGCSGVGEAFAS